MSLIILYIERPLKVNYSKNDREDMEQSKDQKKFDPLLIAKEIKEDKSLGEIINELDMKSKYFILT